MALVDKLKDTVVGAVHIARAAGQQVQSTAAPAVRQAARLVRSQVEQRRAGSPSTQPPEPPPAPAAPEADVPGPPTEAEPAKAAPTPAVVAKNIAPKKAAAKPASKRKPAKKAVPGAKLPVKRPAAKPDSD